MQPNFIHTEQMIGLGKASEDVSFFRLWPRKPLGLRVPSTEITGCRFPAGCVSVCDLGASASRGARTMAGSYVPAGCIGALVLGAVPSVGQPNRPSSGGCVGVS